MANTRTSLLLHGSARAMEELAAGLCWLHWHSSRGRKKGEIDRGVWETCPTTASVPHQAGPGPSGADLEWGTPQCAHYCSELRSEGQPFHPEDSQVRGGNHIMISRPPLPALWGESLCPGVTHIPPRFVALWSAPALTSMSMISRPPDQAARWTTVKPRFPKKREEKNTCEVTKSQVNSQLLKSKKQGETFIYSKGDILFLWGKQINGAGTSGSLSGRK